MKQFTLAYLIMMIFCFNVIEAQKVAKSLDNNVNQKVDTLIVKDSTDYSKEFLAELSSSHSQRPGVIKLIDSVLIMGKDTVHFPDVLKMNREYLFKAVNGDQSYQLKVKRRNESTLSFDYNQYNKKVLVFSEKGEANIGPSFYLASEMDVDDQTGMGYNAHEYTKESDNCWFVVRIGVQKDAKNRQRAKVHYGCKGKGSEELSLKDCPTLKTN